MKKIIHNNIELIFDEEKHKYTSGVKIFQSVTQNISKFFPKFNMQKQSFMYAINHNKNQHQVIKKWKKEGNEAGHFGTVIHKYIENILLKKENLKAQNEKEQIYFNHIEVWFKKFLKYYRTIAVEKIIFTPRYEIAGTVDAIFQNKKTKRYLLIDWKTSKKIETKNKWQNCLCGFEKFQCTSFNKFMFQLNSYLYILKIEKYYKFYEKPEMFVIHLSKEGIENIKIPLLTKEDLSIIF